MGPFDLRAHPVLPWAQVDPAGASPIRRAASSLHEAAPFVPKVTEAPGPAFPSYATMRCRRAGPSAPTLAFCGTDGLLLAAALRCEGFAVERLPLFVRTVEALETLRFVMLRIFQGAWRNVYTVAFRLFAQAPRPPSDPADRYVSRMSESFFAATDDAEATRALAFNLGFNIGAMTDAILADYAAHVRPLVAARSGDILAYVQPYRRDFRHV